MELHRIIELYQRWKKKQLSADEEQELSWLMGDTRAEDVLKAHWEQEWEAVAAEDRQALSRERHDSIFQSIVSTPQYRNKRRWRFPAIAAAVAAVATFLTVGWLLLDFRQQTLDNRLTGMEVLPGGNRATLTLADGRVVELSDTQEGIIVGDNRISYPDGSAILESRSQSHRARLPAEETRDQHIGGLGSHVLSLASITTPKGGTYSITLPDGSKVWLNAGTTLRYPERFDGDERIVELEGEAFFEVRQQILDNRQQTADSRQRDRGSLASSVSSLVSHQPFLVKTQGQVVEVLGTSFNISAYRDEPETKTTLVEGAVQVILSPSVRHPPVGGQVPERGSNKGLEWSRGISDKVIALSPGQQARVSGRSLTKSDVDVSEFIAWKEGNFLFKDRTLQDILFQLTQWYDVEFEVKGSLPIERFNAIIARDRPLSHILRLLEETGVVRFKAKDRTIQVYI